MDHLQAGHTRYEQEKKGGGGGGGIKESQTFHCLRMDFERSNLKKILKRLVTLSDMLP